MLNKVAANAVTPGGQPGIIITNFSRKNLKKKDVVQHRYFVSSLKQIIYTFVLCLTIKFIHK